MLIVLIVMASVASGQTVDTAVYKVTFDASREFVKVSATIPMTGKMLSMYVNPTPSIADGQASFVRNLKIKSIAGDELPLKYKGLGDWTVSGKIPANLMLEYEVRLDHQKHAWDFGIEEVSYVTEDGVFMIGSSLFIISDVRSSFKVIFDVPADWNVSTPWQKTGANEFVVDNRRELLYNTIFAGTHTEEVIDVDGLHLVLVMGSEYKSAKQLFESKLIPTIKQFNQVFGGSLGGKYMAVVNKGNMTDGGAFLNSYSMVIEGPATEAGSVVWAHGMSHEICHLWNGISIQPAGQDEWFKEGFTDYITFVAMKRAGVISEELALKRLENSYRKYLLAKMMMGTTSTLKDAGEAKAENRLLIYGGGAIVAFGLDVEIRVSTHNKQNLDNIMAELYRDFAKTGKNYSMEDLIMISSRIADKDMRPFFERFVTGKEMFPMNEYLKKAGLQMHTFVEEIYISKSDASTASEKQIGSDLFGL